MTSPVTSRGLTSGKLTLLSGGFETAAGCVGTFVAAGGCSTSGALVVAVPLEHAVTTMVSSKSVTNTNRRLDVILLFLLDFEYDFFVHVFKDTWRCLTQFQEHVNFS
jgi:hypothetical protein